MRKAIGIWAAALCLAAPAAADPLRVVTVTAPNINCVFNPACAVVVDDSIGEITMPNATGLVFLQSRTYPGVPGAAGNGLTAYVYRLDAHQAVATAEFACITDLAIDFGPVAELQYDGAGDSDHVYVVTRGGIGSVGILSAEQTDNVITFVFERPVCATADGAPGQSTFFFGLAASGAPVAGSAKVAIAGMEPTDIGVRAPAH